MQECANTPAISFLKIEYVYFEDGNFLLLNFDSILADHNVGLYRDNAKNSDNLHGIAMDYLWKNLWKL